MTKKGLHWGRQCSLRARLPWAFPVPPSCPQGNRTAYKATAPLLDGRPPAQRQEGKGYLNIGRMVPRSWAQSGCPAQESLWGN